jgi:dynein heavy chain
MPDLQKKKEQIVIQNA